ncbi:MAG: hypothetical protein H6797_04370 [Candidatus Nomurabacteria bacterium]|nr:MAG: hypothetical protein H6797_04370 [Candidatus Nomurabacteria bacterium]
MTSENVPAIKPNKQFPIGDVVYDSHRNKKVSEWFERVEDMDRDGYSAHVNFHHAPTSQDGEKACLTHDAAVRLCQSWDNSRADGVPASHVGYRLVMTFNQQARLLPKCDVDLTKQLTQMCEQQKHLAREFARFAWESIADYPHVYAVYERLLEIGRTRFALDDEEDRDYFKAGMALPFMFAWTSRLEGYTPKFSGMIETTGEPDSDSFGRCFTT